MAGQHVTAAIVIARFHHRSYGRKRKQERVPVTAMRDECVCLWKKDERGFLFSSLEKEKKRVIFGGVSERRQSFSPPSLLRKERDEKETE